MHPSVPVRDRPSLKVVLDFSDPNQIKGVRDDMQKALDGVSAIIESQSPKAPQGDLKEVVRALVEAADILLDKLEYHEPGWEKFHLARTLAHTWVESGVCQ